MTTRKKSSNPLTLSLCQKPQATGGGAAFQMLHGDRFVGDVMAFDGGATFYGRLAPQPGLAVTNLGKFTSEKALLDAAWRAIRDAEAITSLWERFRATNANLFASPSYDSWRQVAAAWPRFVDQAGFRIHGNRLARKRATTRP